ncbi:DNase I-like protein, partial [Trametes cingulata]
LGTLNMKGFGRTHADGTTDKWLCLNQLIRDRRLTCLALQEAHLTDDRLVPLRDLFSRQLHIFSSALPGNPTAAGGVGFAVSRRNLAEREPTVRVVLPGRALLLMLPWSASKQLRILNVYAPNVAADNAAFWLSLLRYFRDSNLPSPDVLMGDFNMVEDALDRLPARSDPPASTSALAELLACWRMTDSWRAAHPGLCDYTYLQQATGSQSRLDRIYVKRATQPLVADWATLPPGLSTDHFLVQLSLANYHAPAVGRGRWTFPLALLDDTPFITTMRKLGLALQRDLDALATRSADCNPQTLFASFKSSLIAAARQRAK